MPISQAMSTGEGGQGPKGSVNKSLAHALGESTDLTASSHWRGSNSNMRGTKVTVESTDDELALSPIWQAHSRARALCGHRTRRAHPQQQQQRSTHGAGPLQRDEVCPSRVINYCLLQANSRGVQNRSACQGWLVRPITRCISLYDAPKRKCTQSGGKNKKRSHEQHECAHGSCRTTFEGASVPALDQRAKRTRRKTRPKSLVRLADSSRGHVATRGSQR